MSHLKSKRWPARILKGTRSSEIDHEDEILSVF